MDNPAEGAVSAVKKVPKWAWIAGAGVTGGILYYRRKSSSNNVDTAAATDATAAGDYGQTYSPLGTVTATPVQGDGFAPSQSAGGLQVSDIADLFGVIHQNDPPPVNAVDLLNSVLPYIGGGAPSSGATSEAPAPVAVAPVAPAPAPPAPKRDLCTGAFPNDAGNGDCYRVDCNPPGHAKGRWHFHKNGQADRVSATC